MIRGSSTFKVSEPPLQTTSMTMLSSTLIFPPGVDFWRRQIILSGFEQRRRRLNFEATRQRRFRSGHPGNESLVLGSAKPKTKSSLSPELEKPASRWLMRTMLPKETTKNDESSGFSFFQLRYASASESRFSEVHISDSFFGWPETEISGGRDRAGKANLKNENNKKRSTSLD